MQKEKSKVLHEFKSQQSVTIRAVQGDLTQEPVDAIVNAANRHLAHGGGVAGAIVRAGGREIQRESDEWVDQNGPVPTGGAAITGSGKLPCRHVIHAVGPVWHAVSPEEADLLLGSAVSSAVELAAKHRLKSISLPGISTGIFGFPKERGARVIIRAVLEIPADSTIKEVNLTNIDAQTAEIFARELASLDKG